MGILSARARPNGRSNTKWRHFVRSCALNGISNLEIDGLATLSEEDREEVKFFRESTILESSRVFVDAFVEKILVILCANACESSDHFAGNCIRDWDVRRPSFCLAFSLILLK